MQPPPLFLATIHRHGDVLLRCPTQIHVHPHLQSQVRTKDWQEEVTSSGSRCNPIAGKRPPGGQGISWVPTWQQGEE